jgi:hypothetical protein
VEFVFLLILINVGPDSFDENGDGVLDLSEFTRLVRSVDKTSDESEIFRMFGSALDLTGEGDRIAKVSAAIQRFFRCLLETRLCEKFK